MSTQINSKQRVTNYGEVYTGEREVNAMLDLVKAETERVDSRFLEPACGDGNFVIEILRRKLVAAKKLAIPPRKKKPVPLAFERQSVIAISSIYGVDILFDNVCKCRDRLYELWNKEYNSICKRETTEEVRAAVRFIIKKNIVCGNALTMKIVDSQGEDTDKPIVFSEWSFIGEFTMQRQDFRFDKLLAGNCGAPAQKRHIPESSCDQMCLLKALQRKQDDEGEFMRRYISDYRRVQDYDD